MNINKALKIIRTSIVEVCSCDSYQYKKDDGENTIIVSLFEKKEPSTCSSLYNNLVNKGIKDKYIEIYTDNEIPGWIGLYITLNSPKDNADR